MAALKQRAGRATAGTQAAATPQAASGRSTTQTPAAERLAAERLATERSGVGRRADSGSSGGRTARSAVHASQGVGLSADRIAERRSALADAAVKTLATLGYARTSLRDIAEAADFSHGVLHYYFRDKTDLMLQVVRQTKAHCVTRYDGMTAQASGFDDMLERFLAILAETIRKDAPLHRLWYDMRNQAMFDPALRPDVAAIEADLQDMIWRIVVCFHRHAGTAPCHPPAAVYALFDGLFQQGLLRHSAAQPGAIRAMQKAMRQLIGDLVADRAPCAWPRAV